MKDETDFTLHHRADILAIVDQMQRDSALTTVEFADGHAIVSSILDVRRDAHAMIFDVARDAEQNRRLFASQTLHFFTELDHVQVAFETHAASLVTLADGPAALVDLPAAVVRLQRREFFRAALPVQPPIRCTVLGEKGDSMIAQAIDISPGGAGLVVTDPAAERTVPGMRRDLLMSLPEVGYLELHATLRTVTTVPAGADGARKVRMGFRFDGLPSKTSYGIQRYVQKIEVDHLRLLRRRDDP